MKFVYFLILFTFFHNVRADSKLAIIIDDLGNDFDIAEEVFKLPIGVSIAILPKLKFSKRIAIKSFQQGRESLMHQPMESIYKRDLGPGGLTYEHSHDEMIMLLDENLISVPHVSGVNNHMGSLLTQDQQRMNWLMGILKTKNLYFIDSRTTVNTKAEVVATKFNVSTSRRDIFLDNKLNSYAIKKQLLKAASHAKKYGSAIAIGHPHSITLRVLKKSLPELQEQGINIISISQIIKYQRRKKIWNQFLYHCLKVARNLKLSPLSIFCGEQT